MKKVTVFLVTILSLQAFSDAQLEVSFDDSMRYNPSLAKTPLYSKLEQLYNANCCNKLEPNEHPTIPKIIHQIWLGPLAIPKHYQEYSKKWQALHPGWNYKLWTEKDLEQWSFASKDLFNKASSYQEKSDILRYEILKKYGGLYVDLDYEPLKTFEHLHYLYSFYVSIEPPLNHDNNITISNAIIGSAPNNQIFTLTLNEIRRHWQIVENSFREEAKTISKEGKIIHLAVNRTMMPFNQAVFNNISMEFKQIAFPPTYMSIEKRKKFFDPIKRVIDSNNVRLYFRSIHPETMARQDRGKERIITNLSDIRMKKPWYIPLQSTSEEADNNSQIK